MDQIKYIRVQIGAEPGRSQDDIHTIVEFVNGTRACSCGLERGITPNLRED